jgi:four helix bundle protein
VSESRNAQSKDDFISKLNIALKEADETAYWLRILKRTEFISQDQFSSLNEDVQELISILVSIIKTTKEK